MIDLVALIDRKIGQLRSSLSGLVRRGELALVAASFFCQVKALDGERFDEVELWQQMGFASRPPVDSEVLLVLLGGYGEGAVAIATNHRSHRPSDLEPDEVVTYGAKGDSGQAQVRHKPDGTLALGCATGKFVEVGGDDEKLLLGETTQSDIKTFADAVAAVGTPTTLPQACAALVAIVNAATALSTSTAGWLATKGKVA